MTRLGDDVVGSFDHAQNSDVDTTAERLVTASMPATRGVQLKAYEGNSGIVYVGNSDVTAGTADATDGFPLGPGEGLFLPIDNANKIYVIASANDQKIFFLCV